MQTHKIIRKVFSPFRTIVLSGFSVKQLAFSLFFLFSFIACAGNIWYVDATRPDDSGPGTEWGNAFQTIQAAVDNASAGDTVLVTNGIYNTGGRTFGADALTNRVSVWKAVDVRAASTNPAHTIIEGGPDPGTGGLGPAAVRGVYLVAGATLSGFTVRNGHTLVSTGNDGSGGGIRAADNTAVISNCVIEDSVTRWNGGGVDYGTYYDCVIRNNTLTGNPNTWQGGGGARYAILHRCVISGNSAVNASGGACGAHRSTLYECIVENNLGAAIGRNTKVYDSIIRWNGAAVAGDDGTELHRCLIYGHHGANFVYVIGNGAVYYESCVMFDNVVRGHGLLINGTVVNCFIYSNRNTYDRGMIVTRSTVINSTIVNNITPEAGIGGAFSAGNIINSIVYYNQGGDISHSDYWGFLAEASYTCTSTTNHLEAPGSGNITNAPFFVDMVSTNFQLHRRSPCVDAGSDVSAHGITNDITGLARPLSGSGAGPALYDMGAYEYDPGPPGSVFRLF